MQSVFDLATLEAIGFREKVERELVLDQLYDAVTELVRARLIKSRGRNHSIRTTFDNSCGPT